MPGMRCTVATCTNSLVKSKKAGNLISYHQFPKDDKIRKRWIQRCRREGKWNPNSCHVCSEHFTKDDFVRDLKSELLNLPRKKTLKETAIPTRNLPPSVSIEAGTLVSTARGTRYKKRENKFEVAEIMSQESEVTVTPLTISTSPEESEKNPIVELRTLEVKMNDLLKKNEELLKKNTEMQEFLLCKDGQRVLS